MSIHTDPTKKHDAILLFDCTDGNPNGDPDAGNQPRVDPETNQGLVTDACLKRKVRNYIDMVGKDEPEAERNRFKLFIEEGAILNNIIARGYDECNEKVASGKSTPEQQAKVAAWMQKNFWDIRMFGAVLSTGLKAGQVWGPVQINFGRSISPVVTQSITITRCAGTEAKEDKENKTMGRKEILFYGLYKTHVFYNPHLASESVTRRDLELLWDALVKSWEFDRSAARGMMACRGLYVFTHANKYGNAPSHKLFDLLTIAESKVPPRAFSDYTVNLLEDKILEGVTLTRLA